MKAGRHGMEVLLEGKHIVEVVAAERGVAHTVTLRDGDQELTGRKTGSVMSSVSWRNATSSGMPTWSWSNAQSTTLVIMRGPSSRSTTAATYGMRSGKGGRSFW